jgi:S1-C subfamily serine protease
MMSAFEQLSTATAAAVQLAGESVVRVEGRRRMPSSGLLWAGGDLVVTANHTVERRTEVRVGLPGGAVVEAGIVGRDPATDLAVLRLPKSAGKPMTAVGGGTLRVGHLALAVARPGDAVQATLGIISAIEGGWRTPFGGHLDQFIQSDVVMYPGFSGGALVDAWGRLVGMNTSGILRGVSLAVPTATIEGVAKALVEHGRIRRGYLGVGVQPARLAKPHGASSRSTGLLVASVEDGSPADTAGLLLGDVLLSLASTPLASMEDLLMALGGDVVGQRVPLEVLRGGTATVVHVTIGERPAAREEDEE